jgi:pimeloyl-ACP methyl ester carboxylesterase
MKVRVRRMLVGLLLFLLLAVGALGAVFVLLRGRTPPITDRFWRTVPGSIAALESVSLGGSEQWVLIRGRDRGNPVVLFLHGGPGMPAMYLAHSFQREMERDFVMVHWDRRGAGKSYDSGVPLDSLHVRRILEDTYELTRLLRDRFGGNRIYLLGHSWGSYLGLLAVHEHPQYYRAFIGTGQIAGHTADVAAAQRAFLAQQASEAGDTALVRRLSRGDATGDEDALFRHGGVLYGARNFWPLLAAGLRAPEYTMSDIMNVKRGADLVIREMRHNVFPKPLEGEIDEVNVPVFLLLGRYDYSTPSEIAAEYLERLRAPLKDVVWFERSAHFPFFEEPARFHAAMLRVDDAVRQFWREEPATP